MDVRPCLLTLMESLVNRSYEVMEWSRLTGTEEGLENRISCLLSFYRVVGPSAVRGHLSLTLALILPSIPRIRDSTSHSTLISENERIEPVVRQSWENKPSLLLQLNWKRLSFPLATYPAQPIRFAHLPSRSRPLMKVRESLLVETWTPRW